MFVGFLAATRQRQTTNVDLSINHIVQDSEVFLQHVIIYLNPTWHCADCSNLNRVAVDYMAQSRAELESFLSLFKL